MANVVSRRESKTHRPAPLRDADPPAKRAGALTKRVVPKADGRYIVYYDRS